MTTIPGDTQLTPIRSEASPLVAAAHFYRHNSTIQFEPDVNFYLKHGVVINTRTCFGMGFYTEIPAGELAGKLCFFVRMAIGNLDELARYIPRRIPYIAFCRRKAGVIRIWPMREFLTTVNKRRRKK